MSHLDYFAVQPFAAWLFHQTKDANDKYENCKPELNPAHFYWLGKWAAFEAVREFIEKGARG